MSHSRLFLGLLLASSVLPVIACATPTDDGENAESQEGEVKKKVKPKGGNGAFDLVAPGFDATGFVGSFTFDTAAIKAGERSEKVPGAYSLESMQTDLADGYAMHQQLSIAITAGAIAKHQLGGLRVRFAEPVTLGSTRVELTPEGSGGSGVLKPGAPWQTAATGASMLVLAGKVGVGSATEPTRIDSVVTEGTLKEIVLPTSRVSLAVDAYDPAYPTPPTCGATYVRAGAQSYTATAPVRKQDGSPNASFVVPQGTRAPVAVNAYGIEVAQATVSGQTHSFTLNRLEIDDVEVAQAGGGSQLVKGTVTIGRKNADGTFTNLNCNFPTHSGIDLPDGTYRVASRAQSSSGVVTSTEDVTFP